MPSLSGMGYYSGVRDAMQLRSQMQERASEEQMRQLQIQKMQDDRQQEQQSQALLRNAFTATSADRVTDVQQQGQQDNADQFLTVGKQLLGVDPKLGLQIIQEGSAIKKSATENQYDSLKIKGAQMKLQGDVASQVNDADSLAEAIPELAKVGVVVPPQYRQWNPQTAEWFNRRKVMSDNWLTMNGLQLKQRQLDISEQEDQSKQADRIERQKLAQRKEIRMQNQYTSGRNSVKPQNEKALDMEVLRLNQYDEFDGLSNKIKPSVAQDVYYLAAAKKAQGLASNDAEAMEQARQEVLSRIDPNTGEYKGFNEPAGGGANPGNVVTPKSQAEFDALPSGTTFINPKDGKTYRKK